jgi:hypothetical protein
VVRGQIASSSCPIFGRAIATTMHWRLVCRQKRQREAAQGEEEGDFAIPVDLCGNTVVESHQSIH